MKQTRCLASFLVTVQMVLMFGEEDQNHRSAGDLCDGFKDRLGFIIIPIFYSIGYFFFLCWKGGFN